jgi:hypothetical protein
LRNHDHIIITGGSGILSNSGMLIRFNKNAINHMGPLTKKRVVRYTIYILSCVDLQGWSILTLFRKLNLVGQLLVGVVLLLFWSLLSVKGGRSFSSSEYILCKSA